MTMTLTKQAVDFVRQLMREGIARDRAIEMAVRKFSRLAATSSRPLIIPTAADYATRQAHEEFPSVQQAYRAGFRTLRWAQQLGTVSFHDPYGQLRSDKRWPYPWSGVDRQPYSFAILSGDLELMAELAKATGIPAA